MFISTSLYYRLSKLSIHNKISDYFDQKSLNIFDQKVHHLMAVCPDLVIIISRSDEPPFAKDQPREQQLC